MRHHTDLVQSKPPSWAILGATSSIPEPESDPLRSIKFQASSQDPTTGKPLQDSFLRPYVGLGTVTYGEPVGTSNCYALRVQANRRFSHGLEFKANWTWSKSLDYGPGDNNGLPLYADRRLFSYSLSSFDRTFITNMAALHELPGSHRLSNPMLKAVLANWNVSATINFAKWRALRRWFQLTEWRRYQLAAATDNELI